MGLSSFFATWTRVALSQPSNHGMQRTALRSAEAKTLGVRNTVVPARARLLARDPRSGAGQARGFTAGDPLRVNSVQVPSPRRLDQRLLRAKLARFVPWNSKSMAEIITWKPWSPLVNMTTPSRGAAKYNAMVCTPGSPPVWSSTFS